MTDLATGAADDAFTADEQAAFDAYAAGADAPQGAADAPPAADGGDAAPPPATAAAAPAADAGRVPGEVVEPDEAGADDVEANKGRFVRHGAFHQERERRKASDAEVTRLRDLIARGDERLRILTEAAQRPAAQPAGAPAQPEPETPPDPNEDIFGYAKYLEKQITDLRSGQTALTDAQAKAAEDRATEAERSATLESYRGDVRRVMTADPTFADAYQHLFAGRVAEMKLYGLSDEEAVQAVREDELALVQSALKRKQSPAELVLQMAKARGFAPKAPVAAAPPAETAQERAARVAAGQATAKSLSSAGGAPAAEMTLETLAMMSEAEFERYAAKNPERVRALMGG